MTPAEIRRRRLSTQGLSGVRLDSPAAVVGRLAAVQSQEFGHALWSLGRRSSGTYADARAAFDRGEFLRTHVLRPTWHFAAPEDVGWLLAVTAPRVHQLNGTMYRRNGLDQGALDRAAGVILDALGEGVPLTRAELGARLGSSGLTLVYQVMYAELEGLVVSGPLRYTHQGDTLRGAQHTYARMADRVPASVRRTGDPAELAYRFYLGHGPASVRDLARWASLTRAAAGEATEAAAVRLQFATVDGERLWFDPAQAPPADVAYGALLLPLYDEMMLSYPSHGFPVAAAHPHPAGEDLFVGSVVVHDENVGTWRRTVRGETVTVEVALAPHRSAEHEASVRAAAEGLAAFYDRKLDLTIDT